MLAMVRRGGALVASTAVVEGRVTLGARVSVWWNAVLRGDDAPIEVGEGTNLQDLVMAHPDPGIPLRIGRDVTVGHHAILHCARIGDRALVGMGAILLKGATVGEEALVAAGAVVPEDAVVAPRAIVAGVPARKIGEVPEDYAAAAAARAAKYWAAALERAGRGRGA